MSPRDRILQRRAKFVAAALASTAVACSSAEPSVCLEPAIDASGDTAKADTSVSDAQPEACLTPALDSAVTDSSTGDSMDTGPMPCLDVDPDAGDTGPAPCLKMPPPDGG
jgi:hypothetical protein